MSAPSPAFRLNIEEAFRFIWRDPAWPRKIGLGLLWYFLSFTIIGGLFARGYLLAIAERTMRAETSALPDWTDYRGLLRRGWWVFVLNLAYNLPLILIGLLIGLLFLGVIVSLLAAVASSRTSGAPGLGPLALSPLLLLFLVPLFLLLIPLGAAISFIIPAATARLVRHERLGAAFEFRAVLGFIRRYLGQYCLAAGLYLGATILLGSLSVSYRFTPGGAGGRPFWQEPLFVLTAFVLLLILIVRTIASFFLQVILAHLIGQLCWYDRLAAEGGGEHER